MDIDITAIGNIYNRPRVCITQFGTSLSALLLRPLARPISGPCRLLAGVNISFSGRHQSRPEWLLRRAQRGQRHRFALSVLRHPLNSLQCGVNSCSLFFLADTGLLGLRNPSSVGIHRACPGMRSHTLSTDV
jgi:hypothetical protein